MTDNKYQRGKIYKIISNQTDEVYVGSTCSSTLRTRLVEHQSSYKRYKLKKTSYMTSYELVQYDDCEIVLLETYPCNNNRELLNKEQEWIDKTPNAININNTMNQIISRRQPIDYKNGKIYKIISYQTQKCYIGSTAMKHLSTRLSGHKSSINDIEIKKDIILLVLN